MIKWMVLAKVVELLIDLIHGFDNFDRLAVLLVKFSDEKYRIASLKKSLVLSFFWLALGFR
jgi:hypothetical protein